MAIPADSTKVHGITDAMVAGAPRLVEVAYMGHNSDNCSMVVLETQLRRLESASGLGWCGQFFC